MPDSHIPAGMIEWPSTLPLPLRDDYQLQIKTPYVQTQMEDGTLFGRRRFRSVPSLATLTFRFTQDEYGEFERWFFNTLNVINPFAIELRGSAGMAWYQTKITNAAEPYTSDLQKGNFWLVFIAVQLRYLRLTSG